MSDDRKLLLQLWVVSVWKELKTTLASKKLAVSHKPRCRAASRRRPATLQGAVVTPEEFSEAVRAAARTYPTLRDVPPAAFPLFLTSKAYLHMLDGTTAQPFFPRAADGSILLVRGATGCTLRH